MNNFTKITAVLLLVVGGISTASAQLFKKIGTNPFTLAPSAALEIESTTKGFLPPRMDTAARNVLVTPAKGLIIYNTTTSSMEVNIGTSAVPVWKTSTASNPTVKTVTDPAYRVLDGDYTVLADAANVNFSSAMPLTLTLPTPSVNNSGKIYIIGKIDDNMNGVVAFSPALKLSKSVTVASLNYPRLFRVQCDGTSWNIID